MAGFLLRTRKEKNYRLYIFAGICWLAGMLAEIAGVQTGFLFGDYRYGKWLGPAFAGVPLLIGVNWFIIVFCSASLAVWVLSQFDKKKSISARAIRKNPFLFILLGALFATLFDWIMEPGAVRLGFWIWKGNGEIPMLNYLSWFLLSAILLVVFRRMRINPENRFAVQLYFIQIVFFLLIRILGSTFNV